MKTKAIVLAVALLLAALASGFGQPVITNQPSWQTNAVGSTAMFSVGATGAPPLFYQWRFNNADRAGATNDTVLLPNVQTTNQGNYSVLVANLEGAVTSAVARLYVIVPPGFTTQPIDWTTALGGNASFSVVATGSPPLSFQWRFNETLLASKTNASLVLTDLQFTNAGSYDAVVTNIAGSATSGVARLTVVPAFTKITNGSPVNDRGAHFACAWADYDNDGYLDLFVTSLDGQSNLLYHSERDGSFRRITQGEIVNTPRDYRGIAWGDYDNDGLLDLYVTSTDAHGFFPAWNDLYRNNGDGTFTPMPASVAGELVGTNGGSEGCTWTDYDRDGFLDLFVARYRNDLLFHNNGDGSFTRITNSPLVQDAKDEYQAAWSDYDNDGWPDMFMSAIDAGTNFLYHNNGDGTFTRITSGAIATNTVAHRPAPAWGDYNNDGFPDLFIGAGDFGPNLLYRNEGNGIFTIITNGELITTSGRSPQWGDFDNDGFVDLFLCRYGLDNLLYRNNGDGTFTRITTGGLVHDGGNSYQSGWGDYDNDGFLDLFVTNDRENNFLYRNNANSNQWLKVKLVGTVSNRSAIGAKVRVQAKIRGQEMWQLRAISNGNGFSGTTLTAHFGLGDATNIDTVRIEWPSGAVQELHNVAAKQFLTITEPPRLAALRSVTNGPFQMQLTSWVGITFQIETSSNLIDWTPWTTVATTNRMTRIDDPAGATQAQQFYRAVVRD